MSNDSQDLQRKNLSIVKCMSVHKNNENSICIEIVNIEKAADENANTLKIFFDADEREINLIDLNNKNEFANFIPVKFENIKVSYSEESQFFALFFDCMMIPFVSLDEEGSKLIFNYFKTIGLNFKKTKTIVTEKEIADGIIEKETIVTSDLSESDEIPTFLN